MPALSYSCRVVEKDARVTHFLTSGKIVMSVVIVSSTHFSLFGGGGVQSCPYPFFPCWGPYLESTSYQMQA